MDKVRLKSPEYDVAVYDGKLVGMFDQVTGHVVPETCPGWFPALTEQLESLKMVEVVEGGFVGVGDDLFHGRDGKWNRVEPGARMLFCAEAGTIGVIPPAEFLRDYEPA